MDEMQATAVVPPRVRRRHSPDFRSEVINAAKQPGTSFSAVARSYSLSPSLVRRWVRESESRRRRSEHASAARLTAQRPHAGERVVAAIAGMKVGTPAPAGFVPLAMKPPASDIRIENLIRPIALGRANWLFAGSLRAGQRAAAIMSVLHTARINGHEPYAYLKDVLERLPTLPASRIDELLPYNWQPASE